MRELTLEDVRGLIPVRSADSHKGSYGTLLGICGSSRYRGAALLCSTAALRCGAGILRLAATEKVISAVAPALPEATYLPFPEGHDGELCGLDCEIIFNQYPKITACLAGCGLGSGESVRGIIASLITQAPCPLLLDADALNCIAAQPDILRRARHTPVITPHIGEFSRLCGFDTERISADTEKAASDFARKYSCVAVVKSHCTVIAAPDGECFISQAGNAGLARGGSGDVLAGIIASYLAQGLAPLNAAKLGVLLHGSAADRCAARLGMSGMLPHDIITDICDILHENETAVQ